ncbi:S8 family serine peptidase [Paenisporosarcina indica]|uniref:S8 family serine peptidase n=1 Tax=Paenisporosarcina indica TaxID=650093 RepID=UPI00094F5DC9|nr:S8 family serine peptidase [Paenisporosarcina indica]
MKKLLAFLVIILLIFPASSISQATGLLPVANTLVDEKVWSVLEENGLAQVIVTFEGNQKPSSTQVSFIRNLGITSAITMQSLPIMGVVATKQQVERLMERDDVLSIYLNEKLNYFNADSTMITGVDKARSDPGFIQKNNGFPVSGDGIGVVINDSGVDGTHKDLKLGKNLVQNVLGMSNLESTGILPISYLENVIHTDASSGHGTHVAGTVGGTGAQSRGKYEGVAPGADLIGYGSGAALFVLDGIGGFDYAITHQEEYNIRVITNSWGSTGDFDPNDPINLASKKAYDAGIVVLFAAGNEGPAENTHNPYAKAPWVISVGAGEKDGTNLADFSSRGTKDVGGTFELDGKTWTWTDSPTVVAPGVDIISTRTVSPLTALALQLDLQLIEPLYLPFYTTMSGTSMATPHVAGIVALLLEADATLSPDEVKSILEQTASDMPGYESWEVGSGYVNAYAALDLVFSNRAY